MQMKYNGYIKLRFGEHNHYLFKVNYKGCMEGNL